MYIVLENGEKIDISDTQADFSVGQRAGVFSDTTHLKEVWYCQFLRRDLSCKRASLPRHDIYEYIAEAKYNHKPTQEELLYAMSFLGLGLRDIVTIDNAYEMEEE